MVTEKLKEELTIEDLRQLIEISNHTKSEKRWRKNVLSPLLIGIAVTLVCSLIVFSIKLYGDYQVEVYDQDEIKKATENLAVCIEQEQIERRNNKTFFINELNNTKKAITKDLNELRRHTDGRFDEIYGLILEFHGKNNQPAWTQPQEKLLEPVHQSNTPVLEEGF